MHKDDFEHPSSQPEIDHLAAEIKKFEQKILPDQEKNTSALKIKKIKSPLANMAIEMASSLAVGVVGGVMLDEWLQTKPLFILIGIFLGLLAGGYNFYRLIKGAGMAGGFGVHPAVAEADDFAGDKLNNP